MNSGYSEAQVAWLLDTLFVSTTSLALAAMRADLIAGINRLPLRERAMVVWAAMGYSQGEIGKRLGIPQQRVADALVYARLRLLVLLNVTGEMDGRERVSSTGDADGGVA